MKTSYTIVVLKFCQKYSASGVPSVNTVDVADTPKKVVLYTFIYTPERVNKLCYVRKYIIHYLHIIDYIALKLNRL